MEASGVGVALSDLENCAGTSNFSENAARYLFVAQDPGRTTEILLFPEGSAIADLKFTFGHNIIQCIVVCQ